jgi:hypothetical protein
MTLCDICRGHVGRGWPAKCAFRFRPSAGERGGGLVLRTRLPGRLRLREALHHWIYDIDNGCMLRSCPHAARGRQGLQRLQVKATSNLKAVFDQERPTQALLVLTEGRDDLLLPTILLSCNSNHNLFAPAGAYMTAMCTPAWTAHLEHQEVWAGPPPAKRCFEVRCCFGMEFRSFTVSCQSRQAA